MKGGDKHLRLVFTSYSIRKGMQTYASPLPESCLLQPMEQREQKPNLFGLCRVATEEDDSQYGIQSVPTLMLFRRGEVLWRTSGVVQKSELLATIDPFLR